MPGNRASRLRALVAVIGILTCTLAGADNPRSLTPLADPAFHTTPHGDTPHDSFATTDQRRLFFA